MGPFTCVGRAKLPAPGHAQTDVPHQRDPNLWSLRLRWCLLVLATSHAFGFLLAVLGCLAFPVVLRAKRALVRLRPRCRRPRSVHRNGQPATDPKMSAADLPHEFMDPDLQARHEFRRPGLQCIGKSLIGRHRDPADNPSRLHEGIIKGVAQFCGSGPTPKQCQHNQVGRLPTGIAMKREIIKIHSTEQPMDGLFELFLVVRGMFGRFACS